MLFLLSFGTAVQFTNPAAYIEEDSLLIRTQGLTCQSLLKNLRVIWFYCPKLQSNVLMLENDLSAHVFCGDLYSLRRQLSSLDIGSVCMDFREMWREPKLSRYFQMHAGVTLDVYEKVHWGLTAVKDHHGVARGPREGADYKLKRSRSSVSFSDSDVSEATRREDV